METMAPDKTQTAALLAGTWQDAGLGRMGFQLKWNMVTMHACHRRGTFCVVKTLFSNGLACKPRCSDLWGVALASVLRKQKS